MQVTDSQRGSYHPPFPPPPDPTEPNDTHPYLGLRLWWCTPSQLERNQPVPPPPPFLHCQTYLPTSQVETEETTDLVEAEDSAPLGDGVGGGLFGHAPRGLHGCAAVLPTSEQQQQRSKESRQRSIIAQGSSGGREVSCDGQWEGGRVRDSGVGEGGGGGGTFISIAH